MTAVDFAFAVELLRRGRLVAFPTETVYGLGADAGNAVAVRRIFAAKGRPVDHPLIVHLADAGMVKDWALDIPPAANALAAAFWPGPMTLILRRRPEVCDEVTGGLETVGLRVPSHPIALELLRQFGGGIAAPSANRFGRISPTRSEHVREELAGEVDLILDGGPCEVGLESTIIDLSRGVPSVLRPGAITGRQIEAVLQEATRLPDAAAPRVSGSLESHYAPRAAVEIVRPEELRSRWSALRTGGCNPVIIAARDPSLPVEATCFDAPADATQFAQHMYDLLRRADGLGADVILVAPPPEVGIGVAIHDRLRKAAAPRQE